MKIRRLFGREVRNGLFALIVIGLLVAALLRPAGAGLPANKAVASGSKVQQFAPGTNVPLLNATLRTSSPQDLLLRVDLECTILTELTTGDGPDSASDSALAKGNVEVWIEFDGKTLPINDISAPGDHTPGIGDDTDHVTFCNREYSRSVQDTENDNDGLDTIHDYIKTKSSHGFEWVLLNAGLGVHTVVVKATLTTSTEGTAVADAIIGNRVLVVEPVHMANRASV